MLYKISYSYNGKTYCHTSYNLREVDTFLDILLALKCEYIKIITFTKERKEKNVAF